LVLLGITELKQVLIPRWVVVRDLLDVCPALPKNRTDRAQSPVWMVISRLE
jgi:hypothetical protein